MPSCRTLVWLVGALAMPWYELEQLRSCCDVQVRSSLTKDHKLTWRVLVRRRSGGEEAIEATDADDGPAIEKAFTEAEKRGWVQRV
jgi:hypothetical protein